VADARWHHLWELFHEALETPDDEREGFLDEVCGNDAVLRQEIEELIAAYQSSPDLVALDPTQHQTKQSV